MSWLKIKTKSRGHSEKLSLNGESVKQASFCGVLLKNFFCVLIIKKKHGKSKTVIKVLNFL